MLLSVTIEKIFDKWRWAESATELVQKLVSGELGDPFPILESYLSNEDENFQTWAFTLMMYVDYKRTMNYAFALLDDPSWQFHICELVACHGGTNLVEPKVVRILRNSTHAGTRYMAACALGQIGSKSSIAALKYAQQHDHELDAGGWSVSSAATEALENFRKLSQGKTP